MDVFVLLFLDDDQQEVLAYKHLCLNPHAKFILFV